MDEGSGEFETFYTRCKDIAVKELRRIKITPEDWGVPLGEYDLTESYCVDDDCDCRKVMIHFVEVTPPHRVFATIGYGWESVDFYTKWMFGDRELAKDLAGAYVEMGGQQSQYSQAFLDIFKAKLTDDYKKTIKRHYLLFKKSK